MPKFDTRDLLKLSLIPKISSTRIRNLIAYFKTPTEVFKADMKELRKVNLIDIKLATAIIESDNNAIVSRQLEILQQQNSRVVSFWDDEYPLQLKNINYPPVLLFLKGTFSDFKSKSVAIVGTRRPTTYGIECAKYFASNLSKHGITVVSGLAAGIDTLAHTACLENGGKTISVFGSGVDVIYPEQNRKLSERIAENGLLVSEYPMGTQPSIKNFPARNRIISGLSNAVIVIESDYDGGGMITARFAFDQNREVYAVPGNINSKKSRGTNKLIKEDIGKIIQNIDDVLEDLNIKTGKEQSEKKQEHNIQLTFSETKIIDLLEKSARHVDDISDETGLTISETLVSLLNLEINGLVRQLPGKVFEIVE